MATVGDLPANSMLRVLEAMDERVVVLQLADASDPRSLRLVWANYDWDPRSERFLSELMGERLIDAWPFLDGTPIHEAYLSALKDQTPVGLPEVSEGDARLPDAVYSIQAVPLSEDLVASVVRNLTSERRAQAALQILNRDLEYRIVEAIVEVRTANEELESFAYSVSHDLRAPLRAMTGFSQYLVETYGDALDGEARYLLGRIQSASIRMSELIDALLHLSRVTRQSVERSPVDLVAVSRELLGQMQEEDPSRKLDFDCPDELVVLADPTLARALLANLLGNAWKFCKERRVTRISLHPAPDGAIVIEDNGVGFDPDYAEQLFRPFGRLHEGDVYEGMGIGLAIVERIVKRHGGRISAEGRPGKGASFTLSLEARPE